jgi:hypothetical protein
MISTGQVRSSTKTANMRVQSGSRKKEKEEKKKKRRKEKKKHQKKTMLSLLSLNETSFWM